MGGRTSSPQNAKYDFTGKERDIETGYDYFGARFYDSRIGRWGGIDPLLEKHKDFTPYNYVLNNMMVLVDPDGREGKTYLIGGSDFKETINEGVVTKEINQSVADSQQRYFNTRKPQSGVIYNDVIGP